MMAAAGTSMGISIFEYKVFRASFSVAVFPFAYSITAGRQQSLMDLSRLRYAPGVLLGASLTGASLVTGARATQSLSSVGIGVCALGVLLGYFVCHESYVRGFLR